MFNKVILIGRLCQSPELKQTPNGVSVTSFSIAVNRSYTPKDGERQADFIDIVAWRGTAEFICKYFSKGKAILVEGNIQTRPYQDKNGNKRKAVEVMADSVHFVESKQSGGESTTQVSAAPSQSAASQVGGVDDLTEIDDDGDLPF